MQILRVTIGTWGFQGFASNNLKNNIIALNVSIFFRIFYYQDHVYEHKSTQINIMKPQIFCLYGVEVAGHGNRHLADNHPPTLVVKSLKQESQNLLFSRVVVACVPLQSKPHKTLSPLVLAKFTNKLDGANQHNRSTQ